MSDPTQIRNQPALTTSSGRIWLVVGGLFAAICVGVLAALLPLRPPGVALVGLIVIVLLYAAMVVARFVVARQRLKLALLAACMIAMAIIALACVLIVSAAEWNMFAG